MGDTIETLRAELTRLERENRDLKSRSKTPSAILTSIEGLETFAIRIGEDERILHINTAFARHLRLTNKTELIGQKATVLRRFLNHEMLMAIVRPEEGQSLTRVAHDDHGKVFEIKTTLHDGMLDIVMQDVTDEQQFRSLVQRYVLKDFDNLSEEDLRTFRFPERRFMTFSFSDLRGFTALTEGLNPDQVRDIVNAYYEETIRAVEENEATVIQLIGDAVLAFYGAPRYFKDHALRAVKTACEQVEKVNDLCERYARAGQQMSKCGVGINSGDVVLGNMGGAGKQSYTAIGPSVNLASRLCSAARGGQVLLTEVVLNSVLEALPPGWEMIESRSVVSGDDEDLSEMRGKIEGVAPLPGELQGKVVSIGPGIKSQHNPASFTFRYLYLLKPKGAKELPVITVESARHGRNSRFLSDERAPVEQAEVVIGKYHIVEALGEGGMGKVWKARDQFGNVVAIKMLSAGQSASSTQLQRFRREADIMRKLSHRNICRIYDVGEAEGATYIAIEHVDGVSLGDVIRHNTGSGSGVGRSRSRGGRSSELTDIVETIKQEKKVASASRSPSGSATGSGVQRNGDSAARAKTGSTSSIMLLPMQRVLAIMCEICEAVQFAHEHGVLHRDLKPENIMLRPDGEPVVMDFGLAKLEGQPNEGVSLSIEGQMVGTIEYMAPEQAQSSKHVTERADVYSLGAILYQLLTGRKHFESSGSLLADAQKLQDYESPKLRQFSREIDRDLETIVLKALRPDPVKRYTSVRHMLEDLKRYQAGDSITARAPTVADRIVKRVRKHRTIFAFSAALLLLALIFGGYAFLEYRKEWGDWTEEFAVDFSQAPFGGPEQVEWLKEKFTFQDGATRGAVEPWPVRDGTMVMKPEEWCWLQGVRIRDDTRVVVQLRFKGRPEEFQICLNARKKVRQAQNNPPGYSSRIGIWGGAMDLITRNEVDRPNNFNSLVASSLPKILSLPSASEGNSAAETQPLDVTLMFERRGDNVALQINGEKVHEQTYLMPLLEEHDDHSGVEHGTEHFENIGVRTWGSDVAVQSISAYRFKLPEKASPTVAGDAIAESGHLGEAVEKYAAIAGDYKNVSPEVASLALTKGYVLAAHRGDVRRRKLFLEALRPKKNSRWSRLQRDPRPQYFRKVFEVETMTLWKEGKRREALANFPAIFKANPKSRIVLECLRGDHEALEPEVANELLHWATQTTSLAGLDVSALALVDIAKLAAVDSLRAFNCRNNQLTSVEALRKMIHLRSLSCRRNRLTSLEPISALKLIDLDVDENRIENLAPVAAMPLEKLSCSRNSIRDLAPLKGRPLSSLECSDNQIDSLEAATELPLRQLNFARNQIRDLEPLRHVKLLQVLDCSGNQIETLEPLEELHLRELNCSGNRLVSLEPFVTTKAPPSVFVFDCDTLPEAEITRAIAAWSARDLKYHVAAAQLALALRDGTPDKIKSLGTEFRGHRYLYVQTPLAIEEAKQFCARFGGHLVTISDEEENEFLRQITPPGANCRIGLVMQNGGPEWVTGEPVNFTPDLTEFRKLDRMATWQRGFWLASRRDRPTPFIIEWD